MARKNRLQDSSRKPRPDAATSTGRGRLARWLRPFHGESAEPRRGQLLLESLEKRQLLAGDVDLWATSGVDAAANLDLPPADVITRAPEGEAAPDLVAFAELLGQVGAKFYGADWCPACTQQKELFGDGSDNLPFIEVTNPDRTTNQVGIDAGITQYPTWEFASGQRVIGVQSLDQLATLAGVTIPVSDTPSFDDIGNQTVGIGSPLHVVVDAYDPGGGPVTTSVSVQDPSLLDAVVISGNRSIRIEVAGFGEMVFQMYEGRAPETTAQILQLVENGFYDEGTHDDPITFHRVIDGFVLQAGDPTGTGASGSTLPDVDDEFHPDLQHNREGILSFAKAGDDTNNSQFFITEGPTRHLDYNHSVLGQLVEGFDVREAISRTATNSSDRPIIPVQITNVEIFDDTENSIVMLRPRGNTTGSTQVTFTVQDADGNTSTETIDVAVVADSGSSSNSQPYLADIAEPVSAAPGTAATLQLASVDIEGDPVVYSAFNRDTSVNLNVDVNATTGLVTVTPPAGFTGTADVEVRVQRASGAGSDFDSQVVEFEFLEAGSVSITLETANTAIVGQSYTNDVSVSGRTEGTSGLTYQLSQAPSGATINATTGVVTWTPTASQVGQQTIAVDLLENGTVIASDSQTVGVGLATDQLLRMGVELTDLAGNEISSLEPGDEFFVTLVAEDIRFSSLQRTGVFSAYADVTFDPTVVAPVDGATIEFLAPFDDGGKGTIGNGLIDELGAFSSLTGDGPVVAEIARVRFRAVGNGSANFAVSPADESSSEVLLLDFDDLVTPAQTDFSVSNLTVFSDFFADDDTFTVAEDAATTSLDVLANDVVTGNSGTLSIDAVSQPTEGGTVTIENGQLSFTPAADFFGEVRFDYTARTSDGQTRSADVLVNVTPVNDNPVAVDDTITVGTGETNRTLDVLANDTSGPDTGETLIISDLGTPSGGGSVSVAADQRSLIYTPPTDTSVTTETFTYVLSDGGLTAVGTVTINLDEAPVAAPDSFTIDEDDPSTSFNVLANDTADTNGETFTLVAVGTPSAGGTASFAQGGASISYQPAADFNGTETVTYTIRDTGGAEATATVTFNVTSVNDAPPTVDVPRVINRGEGGTPTEQTLLRISDLPSNVDSGETLTFTNVSSSNASAGTVSIDSATGNIVYLPSNAANQTLTDTITYTVSDGNGGTATGTITVDVINFELRDIRFDFASATSTMVADYSAITTLVGTDINGNPVSMTPTNGDDGPVFTDLLPGDYEVVVAPVPFLQNGESEQRIRVNSGVDDGDTTVRPELGRLRPEFLSIQDFLGSTPRRSILLAVAPGEGSVLNMTSTSVDDVQEVSATLNASGDQLVLRGTDSTSDEDVEATLPVHNDARVQLRGTAGEMRLFRVNLDSDAVSFAPTVTPTTPGPAASSDGMNVAAEGEFVGNTTPATDSLDVLIDQIAEDDDDENQGGNDVVDQAFQEDFGDA